MQTEAAIREEVARLQTRRQYLEKDATFFEDRKWDGDLKSAEAYRREADLVTKRIGALKWVLEEV